MKRPLYRLLPVLLLSGLILPACTFDASNEAVALDDAGNAIPDAREEADAAQLDANNSDSGLPPGPDASADAAIPDAAIPDAAIPDAAIPDAAIPDAEVPDAEVPDAEVPDAGEPDADQDAA